MAKVFPTSVKKIIVQQGGGGSTGEVDRERLQYDNRNTNRRAVEQNPRVSIVSQEMNQKAEDTVTAAVLGQANEINQRAVETSISTVTGTANEPNRKAAVEMPMIAGSVAEMNRKASDATTATVVPTADVAKRAVEDISNTVTATAAEAGRRQADLIETVIIPLTDVNRKAAPTTVPVTIQYGQVFPAGEANAVAANTNWANPNNAIGNTPGAFAQLSAASSGLAGITSNTVSGTLSLSYADLAFSDIPLAGATITLTYGFGLVSGGTLPLGQSASLSLQYSLDNGASWTNLQTFTAATGDSSRVFNVTAAVGGDYAKLNALQVRATGSVTSGTGLGATFTARLYGVSLKFIVSKTY